MRYRVQQRNSRACERHQDWSTEGDLESGEARQAYIENVAPPTRLIEKKFNNYS